MLYTNNLKILFVTLLLSIKGAAYSFESAGEQISAGKCVIKPEIKAACANYRMQPNQPGQPADSCEKATFGDGDAAAAINLVTLLAYTCLPGAPTANSSLPKCSISLLTPANGCNGGSEKSCGQKPRKSYCVWKPADAKKKKGIPPPPADGGDSSAPPPADTGDNSPPPQDNGDNSDSTPSKDNEDSSANSPADTGDNSAPPPADKDNSDNSAPPPS